LQENQRNSVLTKTEGFQLIAEVSPPELPNAEHLRLEGKWSSVLVTDNVFGRIRISPFAYGARVTHDLPGISPTVVVSTRDRNILAIESEVRGALGNGVTSFFVVTGDTMPAVDHMANHYEIVRHLRDLQEKLPALEIGMPTRFASWMKERRIAAGAQFFCVGPVVDPATVAENVAKLDLQPTDPPVFLMVIPPFSLSWIERMEGIGAVAGTAELKDRLREAAPHDRRAIGWEAVREINKAAEAAGCAGTVLMGLKFETLAKEAPKALKPS
jgi:5,10-methylenetetrahydrofolate reductase